MLAPKRVKFRKRFKGRTNGMATRGNTVAFGHYGLMSLDPGWVTNRQIEAARVAVTREMKRGGKVWIRLFPDKPITKKPAETRMGKGKGNPEGWVAVVKPGRIMFELEGIEEAAARAASSIPSSSNMIRPGFTTATHPSGFPLPFPIRVSAGFFVIGLSGNSRIHTLPPRFISRVSATRAASICRLEIQPGSSDINP